MQEPIEPSTRIIGAAIRALLDLGVSDRAGAEIALASWARRNELDADEYAHVLYIFGIRHPNWCTKDPGEWLNEGHVSRKIPGHAPTDAIAIWITARQAWPPHESLVGIGLEIVEESVSTWYPLSVPQGRVLGHALRVALRIAAEAGGERVRRNRGPRS